MGTFLIVPIFSNENISVKTDKGCEYHNHDTYEVWYDSSVKNPAYVIWDFTNVDAIESEAVDNRKSSSFIKCGSSATQSDFKNTGFDRGHMCPNNDRDWNADASKNTFRMCNVCPQSVSLNRGEWKSYEKKGHDLAHKYGLVTIMCGPIFEGTKNVIYIGKNNIRVPDRFFKIFYYDGKVECYLFSQDGSVIECSIRDIEKLIKVEIILK